jgi:stearoyl-CoA desaturase (Delta-9 desaturase)
MIDKHTNVFKNWKRKFQLQKARYQFGAVFLFVLLHAGILAVWWTRPTFKLLLLLAATYSIRMFGVTAGYHRYFGHRSYKLGRMSQFVMAFLAQSSGQKGVLWWAAHHRLHHRESDRDRDVHSPSRRGFWWAHIGWVLSNDFDEYDPRSVGEFLRFPEIRWLDRHHWLPTVVFGAGVALAGGWPAFLWGYVVSTVILYHCTFAINSLAHLWGTRRFDTADESRNNWWLALITLGEGWHNNHHHYQSSAKQGFFWWEIDVSYYLIRVLGFMGIVWGIREPARKALAATAEPAGGNRVRKASLGQGTKAPDMIPRPT